MSRIRVALFEERSQAEELRRRLEQASIAAAVRGEGGWVKLWFMTNRQAGVGVEVSASDANRAWRVLFGRERDSESGWLDDAIRCPECHSLRVEYPQFTEKSLLTNIAMGLMAELGLVEKQYYCEDCHQMWSKRTAHPPRSRPHLAPDYFLEGLHSGPPPSPEPANIRVETREQARTFSRLGQGAVERRFSAHLCSRWRRTLGVVVAAGGTLLFLGDSESLFASQTESASSTLGTRAKQKLALTPGRAVDSAGPTYLRDIRPILMGKCARCHNDESRLLQNWMDYSTAARKRWEIKRRIWDSWQGRYFKQPMPVENSPEHGAITDEERLTIRRWAESGAPCGVRPASGGGLTKEEKIESGKKLFGTICATCHQPSGQGIPGRFPPLAGSAFLNADKHRAIQIVVNGLQGQIVVNGQEFNNSMPKFPLTDEDVANALTYVYNSFGNSGKEVAPEEVNQVRGEPPEVNLQTRSAKAPEAISPYE